MDASFKEDLKQTDWTFQRYQNSGIHSIHWYPATFIAAIPGTLIPKLTEKNSVIMDPFLGSGTTAIEAIRLGHSFIGFDTNPVSVLISKAKAYYPAPSGFKSCLNELIKKSSFNSNANLPHTNEDELKHWYHPNTLHELNLLFTNCLAIKNVHLRECFLAIFSSILKATCSQGKHWGWVCDNVKPKQHEITYKDAISTFHEYASKYIEASENSFQLLKEAEPGITRSSVRKRTTLRRGDCVKHMKSINETSVDLILTSPPYYGVADYVKSQRLSYLWFDHPDLDNKKLGYKFFETLRKEEKGTRSTRHRATSRADYIDFITTFLAESNRVLKKNGKLALIVGESSSREETTDTLITTAEKIGFTLEFRKEREIVNSKRRLMAKVKSEDILVFVKR